MDMKKNKRFIKMQVKKRVIRFFNPRVHIIELSVTFLTCPLSNIPLSQCIVERDKWWFNYIVEKIINWCIKYNQVERVKCVMCCTWASFATCFIRINIIFTRYTAHICWQWWWWFVHVYKLNYFFRIVKVIAQNESNFWWQSSINLKWTHFFYWYNYFFI